MKRIVIDHHVDGRMVVDFDGFPGDTCLQEREQLLAALRQFGINTEAVHIEPKRSEVELRKLPTSQAISR